MSLKDSLKANHPVNARRKRDDHPKGWEPGVRFEEDSVRVVTTGPLEGEQSDQDWNAVAKSMGLDVPDGYRVRVVEAKYDPAAWGRDDPDEPNATTRAVWRYRFAIEPDQETFSADDAVDILNRLKRSPKRKTKASGNGSLIVNLNDTQIGKDTGGGTEATLERLDHYFSLAQEKARDVRKQTDELVILLGGDLVEGCFIYPNQVFEIDLDRRQQIRITQAVILDMLDRLAPEYDKVRVLAVPGNHGEHRINGRRVNRHDNDDQVVAEAVAVASGRDENLNHVAFTIAYDEPYLTSDIRGHVLGLTHGSVYGKGFTGSPAQKAYGWFKNQAAGRQPIGDASILVGNHYHHEVVTNFGALLFVQNPAMDGGSPFFADQFGSEAAPGMATWIMTEESRFTGYDILRG
jgi:hypothetical protein